MKTFIIACVVAIVLATGAGFVLELVQMSSQSAYSSGTGARV